jgi:RNA polymerase sigma factor (sigma-70 family)
VLQEAYLKAYLGQERFSGNATKLKAWVCRIARNTMLNRFRSGAFKVLADTCRFEDLALSTKADQVEQVYIDAFNQELLKVLAALRGDKLSFLKAHTLEELPRPEMAERFNMRPGGVGVKLSRIRKQVKETLRIRGFDLPFLV